MKKVLIVFSILTLGISLLTGCIAHNGLLASDQSTADEYMTNNPELIEKYGEDYTFSFTGGGGVGEINTAGKTGEMSFDYLVNDKDTYTVSVKSEKGNNWKVQGLICISCQYECDEAKIFIDLRNQNSLNCDSVSNGILEVAGIKKDTIITLTATRLTINDAKLWESYVSNEKDADTFYKAEWDKESMLLDCDIDSQVDEFTATVQPEYQDYLGKDLTVLHFHAVE